MPGVSAPTSSQLASGVERPNEREVSDSNNSSTSSALVKCAVGLGLAAVAVGIIYAGPVALPAIICAGVAVVIIGVLAGARPLTKDEEAEQLSSAEMQRRAAGRYLPNNFYNNNDAGFQPDVFEPDLH